MARLPQGGLGHQHGRRHLAVPTGRHVTPRRKGTQSVPAAAAEGRRGPRGSGARTGGTGEPELPNSHKDRKRGSAQNVPLSRNHRTGPVVRDHSGSCAPASLLRAITGRRAVSRRLRNISSEGDSAPSLGNLFQCFVTHKRSFCSCSDAQNAFKVRISIKTALGENAYAWDANEEYLFRAMVAFAMRRYSSKSTTQITNVLLCNVTDRVSFWFVVTDSSKNVTTVPGSEVEAAIRMNRNRINNAFLLSDKTLQFLKITSTLSPPVEPSTPVWIIVFGVVLCLIVAGIVFLIVSGIQKHKKKNKESTERENLEEKVEVTLENGIPCEALDLKAGHINGVFAADDERFTSL